jgi:hypothetical protein
MTPAKGEALVAAAYDILHKRGKVAGQGPTMEELAEAVSTSAAKLRMGTAEQVRASRTLIDRHRWVRAEKFSVSKLRKGKAGRRITEAEVANVVIELLDETPNGEMSFAELFEAIPTRLALSLADLVTSTSRPSEQVWMQQVRNITAHQGAEGNAIREGRLVPLLGGGFALPRKKVTRKRA